MDEATDEFKDDDDTDRFRRVTRFLEGDWLGLVLFVDHLDDFCRYIVAWKLSTAVVAEDVTDAFESLQAYRLRPVNIAHRPRLYPTTGRASLDKVATWLDKPGIAAYPPHAL